MKLASRRQAGLAGKVLADYLKDNDVSGPAH